MSEKVVVTPSERLNMIAQVSNLLLAVGVLALFLSSGAWFWVSVELVQFGVLGMLGVLIAKGENWHTVTERLMIVGMMLGIIGMFQSNFIILYQYGFYVLGLSTLGFIIILHVPKPEDA